MRLHPFRSKSIKDSFVVVVIVSCGYNTGARTSINSVLIYLSTVRAVSVTDTVIRALSRSLGPNDNRSAVSFLVTIIPVFQILMTSAEIKLTEH